MVAADRAASGASTTTTDSFPIWNVAWVARTLVVDPLHVFDANIFYPHRWTLAYSESNLGAGALAIPAYWADAGIRSPRTTSSCCWLRPERFVGMYYLVRHLTGDRGAAAVSAICFAFCPFVFAHIAHIQLLMTRGPAVQHARVPPVRRSARRRRAAPRSGS